MAKSPLQAAHANDPHGDGGAHHIVPTMTYFLTLVVLTVLMLATVFAAKFDIPAVGPISGTIMNQTVALIIAIAKASLVVFIFMGVRWGTKLTKLWAATGFVWFFFLGLVLIDYPMRAFESVDGWEGTMGKAGHPRDGSALPRVVTPSSQSQQVDDPNEINVRPRQ